MDFIPTTIRGLFDTSIQFLRYRFIKELILGE